MNKIILLFFCFLINAHLAQSQIDISAARNMAEGETVTIQGVATNGAELGIIRYLQDDTGGLPVYPGAGSVGNFPDEVSRGDLVQVTGVLKIYNGLLEIDPIESYTVISSNNALPTPQLVSPDGINEENEAKLLTIENVVFDDAGATFSVGNYTFTQNGGGESSEIYVRSGSPLIGMPITQAAVNLTGISSEFNGLYQLLLRDENDIEIVDDFYITEQLSVSDISTDGFTVSWKTNVPASSNVRIGTTPDMTGEITNSNSTTNHSISIEGLAPANFYYLQAFSDNGISTVNSTVKLFSTASQSTGEIRVYFNHPVDNGFSNGSYPSNITPAALEQAIINRINAATTSIDCALYNINRESIVQALSNAHNNGVTVRYISDDQTNNDALSNPTPPFPVLAGNAGDPLMHNKFFIIDADSEDDSWVIMGSTNMTTGNLADDYNNMVFIQDQALAKAYKMEFEEMWGTDGPQPGIFNVRFGEDKSDNTPHLFMVGGHLVESYFSPSDNTSLELVRAVRSADDDLQFALLTFTYNELGTAVLTEHNEGTVVRGIIDNVNDQGTEFSFLQGNGVNVSPDNQSVITHHKYCIVDATNTASDPLVITGSHNWSTGAELRNDENTLIIHHPDVANIFLQEFEARWCEANGGTDCI
ncbi:MAG TPA: hypothetical protein ENJ45_01975, partial [Phaeodactylibacter sp.]|nr:hypothetical protein [Phaeodactylibacter sp.]